MYERRPRSLSQSSYQKLQELHREADRLRQVDHGLVYRRHVVRKDRAGREIPLHIGPAIEAVRISSDRFEA